MFGELRECFTTSLVEKRQKPENAKLAAAKLTELENVQRMRTWLHASASRKEISWSVQMLLELSLFSILPLQENKSHLICSQMICVFWILQILCTLSILPYLSRKTLRIDLLPICTAIDNGKKEIALQPTPSHLETGGPHTWRFSNATFKENSRHYFCGLLGKWCVMLS